jgi:YVTN family beta-propeller protein
MRNTEQGGQELEVQLLGPVEARKGGQPLLLGRRKQRALVALLALNANRVVSTDELIEALWGEDPPPTAPVALYGLVSGLRKLLEPGQQGAVVTKTPGYVLALPPASIDLGRFELLVAEGRRALETGDPTTASARLGEALELWRGPPLQDLAYLPFAQREIDRLDELRLAALETRIDADLARGRNGDLVSELESLVAEHPLRERLRAQLMTALYRDGRQADALAAYKEARAALVELGLEPAGELRELERAILRHDPSLSASSLGVSPRVDGMGPERGRAAFRGLRSRWLALAAMPLVVAVALGILFATSSGEGGSVSVPANGIGIIEHGKVVAAGEVGPSPSEVAAGDGSLWVTSTDDQTVSRIDPQTGDVRQTITVGSGASGIAADDHGIWVANSLAGTVSRIDPKKSTGKVVQTIRLGGAPAAVALGLGSVWIASPESQTLFRLDARTGARLGRIPVGAAPRALAVGAGSLWVSDEKRGVVFRLDPPRPQLVDTIAVGNGPVELAFGQGSLWVANNLDGTVSRIDSGRDKVTATIEVGDGPRGIAVSRDDVWVGNEFDGTVALIDARTNRVTRTLEIGGRPQGLAAAYGRAFVAVRSAGAAHRGGTLRAVGTPPARLSLDTVNAFGGHTLWTNDGLLGYRRVGGVDGSQLVPDLAIAVPEPTDGGRTYTFRVRSGIHYSNGRLVQPKDFRRALERGFLIGSPQVYGPFFGGIVGAGTCAPGPPRCDLSRGIVVGEKERTVTFHLREPDPDFLMKLALPIAFAVPADTPAKEALKRPLPATGPYMVDKGKSPFTLVRNPQFREWSKAAQPDGYVDRIVITAVKSPIASLRAVERGSQDVSLDSVPTELEREVRTQYASQVHVNPVHGNTYLFLNTKIPPFDDIRVRRAVNYAADRAAAVRVSSRIAGGEPTCQILPPEFPGFRRYCPYTLHPDATGRWKGPDLSRARRLVAASGTSGASVTVLVPDSHEGEGPFARKLLQSLGYRVRLERVSDAAYLQGPRRVQAGLTSWFADFPAASNYFGTFFSCRAPANWSEFCDRSIDAQIRKAIGLQTTDPYLANQLWARVDREIVDRAPFVPLVSLKEIDIVSPRVGNYQFHPQWGVFVDQLWVR